MSLPEETILRQIDRHRVNLLAYAWLLTSNIEVAEECFDELKRIALKRKQELNHESVIPLWCRRTARSEVLARFGYTGTAPFPLRTATLDLIETHWRDRADEAIECGPQALKCWAKTLLPSALRIVALRYGQKLSGKKVAQILNRKPSTVYGMLGRIHRRLSQYIRSAGANRGSVHA